jgi:hypothetical protein
MCVCEKPTINGELGYRWNDANKPAGVYRANPPELGEGDSLLYDEPGRCGGQDSHSYHYRVVQKLGTLYLLVRHGGGDERVRLSNGKVLLMGLELLGTSRYWTLNAIYHAHADGASDARQQEAAKWRKAAAEKRIRTRKLRGRDTVDVRIVPLVQIKGDS